MLLDALTYVIDADSGRLDKSISQSEKKVNDLEHDLKKVEDQAGKTGSSFASFAKMALGYLGAYLSVSKAFSMAGDRADFVAGLTRVSQTTNTAIEDVDALGKSLESIGGTSDGAASTLEGLSVSVGRALNNIDSQQAKTFAALGISLKDAQGSTRSTIDVMQDLASAVGGMDASQATARLNQLGITDRASIELILKGRQELDRMMRTQREGGVVTKESAEAAKRYNDALYTLKNGFGDIGNSLIDKLIPILTKVIEWFGKVINWAKEHEHIVTGAMIAIAAVAVGVLGPAILGTISPFLLVGSAVAALIALFVLLYDDIMNFIEGNDSLIGQILEKYPIVAKVINWFGNEVRGVFSDLVKGYFFLNDAANRFINKMILDFKAFAYSISTIFGFVVDLIKGAFSFITQVWDKISGVFKWVADALGLGGGKDIDVNINKTLNETAIPRLEVMDAQLEAANRQMTQVNENPLNSMTPQAIANSNIRSDQNIQIDNITIQSQATDSEGISRDIRSGLENELSNMQSEFSSGAQS